MDFTRYAGLIEFCLVISFVLGWAVLELVGLRLDKKREMEKKRLQDRAAANIAPASSSSPRAGHPEG
jgi:hypothetical protein